MARATESWDELKVWMDGMDAQLAKMPPPPTPRDSWSEKVNVVYRALEGMREQVRSEIESEEQRAAALEAMREED